MINEVRLKFLNLFKELVFLEAFPLSRAFEHPIQLLWNFYNNFLYCDCLPRVWHFNWQGKVKKRNLNLILMLSSVKLQASMVVSSWRLCMSLVCSVALMKLPRRPLFLFTALLISVSMFSLGLFSYFQTHGFFPEFIEQIRWTPLVLVLLIFAGAQLGYGPIIKVLTFPI